MGDQTGVQSYFERHAASFDALYGERNPARRLFNHIVRPSLYQRLDLAVAEVRAVDAQTVLDVGCGSGRNTVAFAAAGALRVVGIDFSGPMLELARRLAATKGVAERCEFVEDDFLVHPFGAPFDSTVALGVLDYVGQPAPFLRRLRALTRRKAIVSAPGPSPLRAKLRRRRYAKEDCPVYFRTHDELRTLMRNAGFDRVDLHAFGPGAVAVGHVDG